MQHNNVKNYEETTLFIRAYFVNDLVELHSDNINKKKFQYD